MAVAMAEMSLALSRFSSTSHSVNNRAVPNALCKEVLLPQELFPEAFPLLKSGKRHSVAHCRRTRLSVCMASALLELVPPQMSMKLLNYELLRFDTAKRKAVGLVVVGAGPAGLAVAQRVSKEGVSVCVVDPAPQSVWPNNYGVWVDEFEDLDLLDCLDYTWASAVVYLDDEKKKTLERPYGRVNRTRLKSKMLEACIANGVQFHQAKVIFAPFTLFSKHECSKAMIVFGIVCQ